MTVTFKYVSFAVVAYLAVTNMQVLAGMKYYQAMVAAFLTGLIVLHVVMKFSLAGAWVSARLTRLSAALVRRGSFRSDAVVEMPKFALIRIVFGIVLLNKTAWILVYLFPEDWSNPAVYGTALLSLGVSAAVTVGFLTQVAFAFLLLVQWQLGEQVLATSTLGNDVAAMLAVLVMLTNAGAHFSVDAVLMRRNTLIGRVIKSTYFQHGIPSNDVIQLAKFSALCLYWCVCVSSLMSHLSEPAWVTGVAGPQLLTNNFMSAYYREFIDLFTLGPFAVFVGKIALWSMLPWYAVVLPFVILGGWWRAYVIVWGLLFFCLSLFVLNLAWLAYYEFLLWAGLFWFGPFMSERIGFAVAYDDRCNLCDSTVRFVKIVDIFSIVHLRPVSQNGEWLQRIGIDESDAMYDLHGVSEDKLNIVYRGYGLYLELAKRVFLLLPVYPILLLGKVSGVGPWIYRQIADRRQKLFGVCKIPSRKPDYSADHSRVAAARALDRANPATFLVSHILLLSAFFLIMLPAPFLGWPGFLTSPTLRPIGSNMASQAHIYGMTPLDVFNYRDLRLSENWFTLTAEHADGTQALVPVLAPDGSRLAMHRSDRIYFGHTVKFRRKAISDSGCYPEKVRPMIAKVMSYYRAHTHADVGYFTYTQYHQPIVDAALLVRNKYVENPITEVCRVKLH